MSRKSILASLVGVALAVAGLAATATSASADATTFTAVSTLTNRPDNSHFGHWALDNFKRTLTVTRVAPVDPKTCNLQFSIAETKNVIRGGCWSYTAKVVDEGTFTTLAGKSPRLGKDITAGLNGTMVGSDEWSFYAATPFVDVNLVNATYNGTAPVPTGDWYKLVFERDTKFYGVKQGPWGWTYKAPCKQQWVDASTNNDGTDEDAGDIRTGDEFVVCPTTPPATTPPASTPPVTVTTTIPGPTVEVTVPVSGGTPAFTG